MTDTDTGSDAADRIVGSLEGAENLALEAVRKFLDTVNGVFPDVSADNGPRQKIIDSAFKMTDQLVSTWSDFGKGIAKVSQSGAGEAYKKS